MAGGNWETQNKRLPGFYLNVRSAPYAPEAAGERGVVAIAAANLWAPQGEFASLESPGDAFGKLGYDITHEKMRFARDIFRGCGRSPGAARIDAFSLPTAGGAAASAELFGSDPVTVTARYPGARGNDISVRLAPDPDTPLPGDAGYAVYVFTTYVDGVARDEQRAGRYASPTDFTQAAIGDLADSAWVRIGGTPGRAINEAAAAALSGGADGAVAPGGYAAFLEQLEPRQFNVLAYDGADAAVKASMALFAQRLAREHGRYAQLVAAGCPGADSEHVISVKNGVRLADGTDVPPERAVWWVAGATAGAGVRTSLTYAAYPDAAEPSPRLANRELEAAAAEGSLAFFEEFGEVKVLTDVNTFTSYTQGKGPDFSSNRVIRTLHAIANDLYALFSKQFIGVADNDATGRGLFRAAIVGYVNGLQGNGAVQGFEPEDADVLAGADAKSVEVRLAVKPTHAVEKIYMAVTLTA